MILRKVCIITIGILTLTSCNSCKEPEPDDDDKISENFNREPMLSQIGNNIILPAYTNLSQDLFDLEQSFTGFSNNPTIPALDILRSDWLEALKSWQSAAFFEFGPAETELLRANINVYPTDVSQIENNVNTGVYDLYAASNLDAKGFQALDYLLYGVDSTDASILV